MSVEPMLHKTLDGLLINLGEMGRYQILHNLLLNAVVLVSSISYISFVFTTGPVKYRCHVPECESNSGPIQDYAPDWLQVAVPFVDGQPSQCTRYQPIYPSIRTTNNIVDRLLNEKPICETRFFNQSLLAKCQEFVYDSSDDVTIFTAFNLTCEENAWRLTIIGTMSYLAQLIGLPICAILSDRYGRKPILMASVLLSSICGIIKSFSYNYFMFATLEFLATFFAAGIFATLYVMAVESAGPSKRFISGALVCITFAFSQVFLGVEAIYVRDFRDLLRILYVPQLLSVAIIWFMQESTRWLMINQKTKQVSKNLQNAARMNRMQIDMDNICKRITNVSVENNVKEITTILDALKSKVLLRRLIICCTCWFTNSFIYYGMTVQSVALGGNKYVNFILVNAVEVPAILIASYWLSKKHRKQSEIQYVCICVIACIMVDISNNAYVRLVLYLIGKLAITIAFAVLYTYTSELFPTKARQTFLNACTMVGTMGTMVAPQLPMFTQIWPSLPLVMFSAAAVVTGTAVLFLPETVNSKLSDTIEEAEALTKRR